VYLVNLVKGVEVIEFRNVCKSFDDLVVLDNVSCVIPEGKITMIIGPSGTGKSVFIKLLVGLEKPDSGEVIVDGQTISRLSSKDLYEVRKKFGVLFQDGALFDSMPVSENVAFPLREHTRLSEKEISEIVAEKLAAVGMANSQCRWPNELSGGMKKRVALARAIVMEPDIVIFDEPSSALDPVTADSIDNLILEMQHRLKCTFVVVSHDIESTFKVADYIGMLWCGKIIAFGTKDEVMNLNNKVVRQFFSRSSEGPIQIVPPICEDDGERGKNKRQTGD
jgi:phospholipid/cholesterol/gamma-HCH transport system ATP-binding protein